MSDPMPNDPLEAGVRIGRACEQNAVPYAIGGALAYGLWAIPRATADVDINIFVDDAALGRALDAMESVGISVQDAVLPREGHR